MRHTIPTLCLLLNVVACGNLIIIPFTQDSGGSSGPHTVGGTITGFVIDNLSLDGGSAGVLSFPDAGATSYVLPIALPSGRPYSVTVTQSPRGLACTVANGSGIIGSADVTNANITCSTPWESTVLVPRDGATDAFGVTFEFPTAVTVDSRGTIYVADTRANAIALLAPDSGVERFDGFDTPIGVAVAPDFTMYVLSMNQHKVTKVEAADVRSRTAARSSQFGPELPSASSLSLGASGKLYVSQPDLNRVITLSVVDGARSVLVDGGLGSLDSAIEGPDGQAYVASRWGNSIYAVSKTGAVTRLNVDPESPNSIAMDGFGNLYSVGSKYLYQSTVRVYPSDGGPTIDIGIPLYYPQGIWVSPAGDAIYVTETGGGLQRLTPKK